MGRALKKPKSVKQWCKSWLGPNLLPKLVLRSLRLFLDWTRVMRHQSSFFHPGWDKLAKICDCSVRTVRRHFALLERLGAVVKMSQGGRGRRMRRTPDGRLEYVVLGLANVWQISWLGKGLAAGNPVPEGLRGLLPKWGGDRRKPREDAAAGVLHGQLAQAFIEQNVQDLETGSNVSPGALPLEEGPLTGPANLSQGGPARPATSNPAVEEGGRYNGLAVKRVLKIHSQSEPRAPGWVLPPSPTAECGPDAERAHEAIAASRAAERQAPVSGGLAVELVEAPAVTAEKTRLQRFAQFCAAALEPPPRLRHG